ncbi:MAG: type II toxin-antitoxin system RelE/ParE family toxin [Opitutaceae bacterium]|nr:type II toxin-antitoxin system RelE/ParE family toxin [Cytophagales bacterium]
MDLKVSWSKSAIEQLETIFDYYKNKANERIAKEIVKRIVDKTLLLETQPRIGPQEELLRSRKFEYRYLLEGNYKIIYWVDEPFIKIATVFDCRRNPGIIAEIK